MTAGVTRTQSSSSASALIWADGALISYDDATMHVLSHATQRGSAVFDVIKIVDAERSGDSHDKQPNSGPHAVGLRGHVSRFVGSMGLMGMDTPYTVEELETAVRRTVVANPGAQVVKLVAAWAEVPLRTLPVSLTPHVWIAAMTPGDQSDTPAMTGTRLQTATGPKTPIDILPPNLKVAASYTAGVRQRMAAVAAGFDDVLFKTTGGTLAEGTTQSLFVISEGQIVVPPLDIVLDGITRQMMIEVAQNAGLRVSVRTIEWREVLSAPELFLASANHCVVPVAGLDDYTFECPGPITQQLALLADELLAGSHRLSPRWLSPMDSNELAC